MKMEPLSDRKLTVPCEMHPSGNLTNPWQNHKVLSGYGIPVYNSEESAFNIYLRLRQKPREPRGSKLQEMYRNLKSSIWTLTDHKIKGCYNKFSLISEGWGSPGPSGLYL